MKRKLFGGAMALVMLFCALAATAIEAGEGPYRVHQHLTARGPGEGCDCDGTELCTHLPLVIIDTGGAEVPGVPVGHDGNGEEVYSTTADGDSMLDARISILDDETRNHHPSDEPDIESAGLIRIRGRSSRHFDKHNYLLRFTKDDGSYASHEVMGMDSHYEWALHGPYLDKSLIRNYLWYNIAGEMMDYAPNVRFCEVILNGEYQGLYLMTETITNGDGCRVNVSEPIDNSKATGYVLRLDQGSKTDLKNINNFTYYTYRIGRKNRLNIDIEYPRSGTLTQEMADAIEQDLSDFEKSLYSFDYDTQFYGYENWIDVNSFADYFLINEFTQNYDAGALSTYLYKDIGGKYILGVEWEDVTVAYTNETHPDRGQYHGAYLETTEDATPFEAMLAQVGDSIIEYETERYRQQRLVAFSNWPTTDPFLYPADITNFFMKCAQVDVEHIQTTDAFLSGCFASYHVYPYYPDYLHNILDPMGAVDSQGRDMSSYYFTTEGGVPYEEMMTGDDQEDYYDLDGHLNTYYAYLRMLNEYHTVPVVISEYGVSTGRGMAQRDYYTGRNQGRMTEREQGDALIDCYEDIMNAGSAGICIFTWQDEWFKRTWNTMANVDLDNTPYWSDYQTNEQYFGLLAFDPGEEESVCYVDGDPSDGMSHPIQVSHLTWMRRRLSHINELLAFDQLMEELDREDAVYEAYIRQLQPVFLQLAMVYWKRESTQAAYYCYFLAKHKVRRHMEMDQFQQIVLSYLKKDSLYCKINALKALCSFGSPSVLMDALEMLGDGQESQLHEKVVTEALLSYTGDADMLIGMLWQRLERFSLPIQRAVLDYIRFQSGGYCSRMLEILEDSRRDKELRLAAIRYFGKYRYPPARPVLLGFLNDRDPTRWEYAAISATALARYDGKDVVDALLRAMNSPNWYIRSNTASSLEAHGLTYEEMLKILGGGDRYAREMLAYRLKAKQLEQAAAEQAAAGKEPQREEELASV